MIVSRYDYKDVTVTLRNDYIDVTVTLRNDYKDVTVTLRNDYKDVTVTLRNDYKDVMLPSRHDPPPRHHFSATHFLYTYGVEFGGFLCLSSRTLLCSIVFSSSGTRMFLIGY